MAAMLTTPTPIPIAPARGPTSLPVAETTSSPDTIPETLL
jgi:hypothetical protein